MYELIYPADMRVLIGIPTCVNPQGLSRLLYGIRQHTPAGLYQVVVLFDGNTEWERLDKAPAYAERFRTIVMRDDPETDTARIERYNPQIKTYDFLPGLNDMPIEILRNPQRLGVTGAWNRLAEHALATDCEYFMILNDDLSVQPRWLDYLLAAGDAYPNGLLVGYGSTGTPSHPGPAWPGLPEQNYWGPCMFMRTSPVRILIGDRGWVFNPKYKLFFIDGYFFYETLNRGFDIVSIADPLLVATDWHRSLGHWVNRESVIDRETYDGKLPAPNGRCFTYIKMGVNCEVTDEKKL